MWKGICIRNQTDPSNPPDRMENEFFASKFLPFATYSSLGEQKKGSFKWQFGTKEIQLHLSFFLPSFLRQKKTFHSISFPWPSELCRSESQTQVLMKEEEKISHGQLNQRKKGLGSLEAKNTPKWDEWIMRPFLTLHISFFFIEILTLIR